MLMGRTILHIDMNSYFASVEQQCNPYLRHRPIAVIHKPWEKTIVTTASYEAKARGVATGMPTWEAKRLCPEILFVVEDLNKYAWTSARLFRLLRQTSPDIEVFSIDEAFLDITQAARERGSPLDVARAIKLKICKRLGACLRCSIGIAPSKILAKIASGVKKPDGLVWIPDQDVEEWLEELPVEAACGIDERIRWRLTAFGVRTLAELGRCDPLKLRREFGIVGHHLWLIGQGKDPAPLGSPGSRHERKSVGHSKVLRWPYPPFNQAKGTLYLLCAKVARRLRALGYAGQVVHFSAGSPHGERASKQVTLPTPTIDEQRIFGACVAIAEDLERRGRLPGELGGLAVWVSRLRRRDGLPLQLFHRERRREELLDTMDRINGEWGEFTLYPLSLHPVREKPNWTVASIALHRGMEGTRDLNGRRWT